MTWRDLRAKFDIAWCWQSWCVGLVLPHGGMVVWSLHVGPLAVRLWPLASWRDCEALFTGEGAR